LGQLLSQSGLAGGHKADQGNNHGKLD
jgi:hypothetical protein